MFLRQKFPQPQDRPLVVHPSIYWIPRVFFPTLQNMTNWRGHVPRRVGASSCRWLSRTWRTLDRLSWWVMFWSCKKVLPINFVHPDHWMSTVFSQTLSKSCSSVRYFAREQKQKRAKNHVTSLNFPPTNSISPKSCFLLNLLRDSPAREGTGCQRNWLKHNTGSTFWCSGGCPRRSRGVEGRGPTTTGSLRSYFKAGRRQKKLVVVDLELWF